MFHILCETRGSFVIISEPRVKSVYNIIKERCLILIQYRYFNCILYIVCLNLKIIHPNLFTV